MIPITAIASFVMMTVVMPLIALWLYLAFIPANFLALPSEIVDSLTYLVGLALAFDFIFPVGSLITAWALMVTFDATIFVWTAFRWVLALLIRGTASGV